MVASSSRSANSQQVQHKKNTSAHNAADSSLQKKTKSKGKGKEKDLSNAGTDERRSEGQHMTEAADVLYDEDVPWGWRPLTDSSPSTVPPIFTKDGK